MSSFPKTSIKQLFPTPGTPVIPTLIEFPLCLKHFCKDLELILLSDSNELSNKVIAF